ncbi:hypothetical protein BDV36DRAFT_287105 [Aspergillus pseudocaelatus]|uniref:Uncharacterized protein n=1 Tax=Aspergillus pseudocaelatus TaxID=1825620 RepID=A0ABQ6WD11_9EURO|nr:hypothetical protein BDV36DRAFT_287105 [Aspergillus pseudocaelatus]
MKSSVSALALLYLGVPQFSVAHPTGTENLNRTEDDSKPQKHENDVFTSFPQPAGDLCNGQLKDVIVEFIPTGPGAFRIDNVPPACMTLATIFLDDPDSPDPVPLGKDNSIILFLASVTNIRSTGSASLGFSGISDDELQRLQAILDAHTQH